jgi:hypothetical protein
VLTFSSIQSHASIIQLSTDQANYAIGDTVTLDISLEDISSDTAELGFDLVFDSTALTFDSFNFSTDVVNSAFLAFADISFFDNNIIEVFAFWLDSSDLPSTSFNLGQVSFTAQQAYSSEFEITDAYLADENGSDLDSPSVSVSTPVSAPSAGILMMFAFVLLPLKRRLLVKRK